MKKQVKILSVLLIVISLLATLTNVVLANNLSDQITGLAGGTASGTEKIWDLGKTIVAVMQTVGVVVAVVVLLILGVKYMVGSAEEKAEYKKTMIPYVVGAILIFAATTIVNVVYNLANGINAPQA